GMTMHPSGGSLEKQFRFGGAVRWVDTSQTSLFERVFGSCCLMTAARSLRGYLFVSVMTIVISADGKLMHCRSVWNESDPTWNWKRVTETFCLVPSISMIIPGMLI